MKWALGGFQRYHGCHGQFIACLFQLLPRYQTVQHCLEIAAMTDNSDTTRYRRNVHVQISFRRIMSKQGWQNALLSRSKNCGFSNGFSHFCRFYQLTRAATDNEPRTAHVKHSQCHLPPRISTPFSVRGFLHFLHFGYRRFTWHFEQYACPLCTVYSRPSSTARHKQSNRNEWKEH